MIEKTDARLGALMDELEEAGELDNTYLIFGSDNGGGSDRRATQKSAAVYGLLDRLWLVGSLCGSPCVG